MGFVGDSGEACLPLLLRLLNGYLHADTLAGNQIFYPEHRGFMMCYLLRIRQQEKAEVDIKHTKNDDNMIKIKRDD